MDRLTSEQRHKNMQRIRGKDTTIEMRFRKALWERGYRYRKNFKDLPGKPDIVLTKYRIAIFCDSEFFHGKDWNDLEAQLLRGKNPEFWIKKIKRNMERDLEVDQQLHAMGWEVLRFWGKEISRNLPDCIHTVEEKIFDLKLQKYDE